MDDVSLIKQILRISKDEISHIQDLDSLLDRILLEARNFTNADAGSIYLKENDHLVFSYVQNDTLYKNDLNNNKFLYKSSSLEIDQKSIAGFVALKGKSILLDDVYKIDDSMPFSFNRSFDYQSGYHTQSMLVVPLLTGEDHVVGVMQLINSKKDDQIVSFEQKHQLMADLFANEAAIAIERAKMMRHMLLRMIKVAALRDPKETGAHVNRVGAYSIEVYHHWAIQHGFKDNEIKKMKDHLRLAAMLHDVGKVAIPDRILKKPGKLTDDEYKEMQYHTIAGAKLFEGSASPVDQMALEVALNHHERWDGKGYPGVIPHLRVDPLYRGERKKHEDIPLCGRIVALSDVYDALISKRCYKDAWSEDRVLSYIEEQAAHQFDPDIVSSFLSIYDVITAIRENFQD